MDNIKFAKIFIRLKKHKVKTKIIKISLIIKLGKAVLKNNAMDKIEKDLRKSSIKHLEKIKFFIIFIYEMTAKLNIK